MCGMSTAEPVGMPAGVLIALFAAAVLLGWRRR
jgi:MYXO-CTERM domain-containing protein